MIVMENIQLFSDSRMMEYAETAEKFRLPRWEQIPTLGLYMDQVVTVIDQVLNPLIGFDEEAIITPSMINNYDILRHTAFRTYWYRNDLLRLRLHPARCRSA